MIKQAIAATLALIVISNITVFDARVTSTYKDGGKHYSYLTLSGGSGWVVNGKLKRGARYHLIVDTNGTKNIDDDKIVKMIRK